jgi:hypothetical protein
LLSTAKPRVTRITPIRFCLVNTNLSQNYHPNTTLLSHCRVTLKRLQIDLLTGIDKVVRNGESISNLIRQ